MTKIAVIPARRSTSRTSARTEARKAAREYARNWSMETLAERYVDVYERAIALYDAAH